MDLETIPRIVSTRSIFWILEQFRSGSCQMAVILDANDNITPIGIVTLEDIFEVLLRTDFFDERDKRLQNVIVPMPSDAPVPSQSLLFLARSSSASRIQQNLSIPQKSIPRPLDDQK